MKKEYCLFISEQGRLTLNEKSILKVKEDVRDALMNTWFLHSSRDYYWRNHEDAFHENRLFEMGSFFELWTFDSLVAEVRFIEDPKILKSFAPPLNQAKLLIKIQGDEYRYEEVLLDLVDRVMFDYVAWVVVTEVDESKLKPKKSPQIAEVEEIIANAYLGGDRYHSIVFRIPGLPITKITMTDPVNELCKVAQCDWLIKIIWSYQHKLKNEPYQKWIVTVDDVYGSAQYHQFTRKYREELEGNTLVTCWRDAPDGKIKPLVVQNLYTDFPLKEVSLIYENEVVCFLDER